MFYYNLTAYIFFKNSLLKQKLATKYIILLFRTGFFVLSYYQAWNESSTLEIWRVAGREMGLNALSSCSQRQNIKKGQKRK